MKGRAAVIAATSLVVLVMAYAAYAGPGCCGVGPGAAGPSAGIWNELSTDQQKQAETLRLEFFKKVETLRGELGKKRVELMELASKDSPDEAAIERKREEIWALRDAMQKEQREMGSKMRSLLTPEQRKKIGPYGRLLPGGGCGQGGCFFGGGKGFRGGFGPGGCRGPWGGAT